PRMRWSWSCLGRALRHCQVGVWNMGSCRMQGLSRDQRYKAPSGARLAADLDVGQASGCLKVGSGTEMPDSAQDPIALNSTARRAGPGMAASAAEVSTTHAAED